MKGRVSIIFGIILVVGSVYVLCHLLWNMDSQTARCIALGTNDVSVPISIKIPELPPYDIAYIKDARTGICFMLYGRSAIAVVPETSVPAHLLIVIGEIELTKKKERN